MRTGIWNQNIDLALIWFRTTKIYTFTNTTDLTFNNHLLTRQWESYTANKTIFTSISTISYFFGRNNFWFYKLRFQTGRKINACRQAERHPCKIQSFNKLIKRQEESLFHCISEVSCASEKSNDYSRQAWLKCSALQVSILTFVKSN